MEIRDELKMMNGKRMRFIAKVERFGTKPNWHGYPQRTIHLTDVKFAHDGRPACPHLWFTAGDWTLGLKEGSIFAFDARVDSYVKGYQGRKAEALGVDSFSVDYLLERPTNVEVLGADQEWYEWQKEAGLKLSAKEQKKAAKAQAATA